MPATGQQVCGVVVWCGGVVVVRWWLRPTLVFSLAQAEQKKSIEAELDSINIEHKNLKNELKLLSDIVTEVEDLRNNVKEMTDRLMVESKKVTELKAQKITLEAEMETIN